LLPDFVKSILRFLGFDRAVSFGILARLWSLVAGPVTMLVIATGFSPEEQGFYYTFSSLLALQIFFDLGLMFVISQFTSHEFVHLTWGPRGKVEGEPVALKRFTDLLCKTVLWFGIAALLMTIVLIPAGLLFFGQKGALNFSWRLPWILAVIGTALNLFVMPFFAVIMGSGDVVTANKRDLAGTVLGSILCWLVIGFNGGLYAAFAVNVGALFIAWGYLLTKRPELVKLAWEGRFGKGRAARKEPGLSWWGEIWPMQWRMGISSGAAYFIFQLFTPVLFHFHGAVVAGQMGLTLTAGNALMATGLTLITAKNPEFAKLVALSNWMGLDAVFFRVLRQTMLFVTVGALLGTLLIWILQDGGFAVGQRFVPVQFAAVFFAAVCVQISAAAFAIYLRSHKNDPLVWVTVAVSLVQGVTVVIFGGKYSISGVVWVYLIVSAFLLLPSFVWIWGKYRREWHKIK
jgi:O-antigen/teichoic acid export membrane protein